MYLKKGFFVPSVHDKKTKQTKKSQKWWLNEYFLSFKLKDTWEQNNVSMFWKKKGQ